MRAEGMSTVDELLTRCHALGADPRNTNYAGGNASAKGAQIDPVTGSSST
jgi:rhamnose utilization protein RhaD (predicted bifunctional aldolase and dehydrogenase)